MDTVKVKIVNKSNNENPEYATVKSAGMDLRAYLPDGESIGIQPFGRVIIPTGIYIGLPEGYEAQVRPRSGLAAKYGIMVLNSPGTIDADYIGEIKVILYNSDPRNIFIVNNGDRIAQMVVKQYSRVEFEKVKTLEETERGEGGFGHTGIK